MRHVCVTTCPSFIPYTDAYPSVGALVFGVNRSINSYKLPGLTNTLRYDEQHLPTGKLTHGVQRSRDEEPLQSCPAQNELQQEGSGCRGLSHEASPRLQGT